MLLTNGPLVCGNLGVSRLLFRIFAHILRLKAAPHKEFVRERDGEHLWVPTLRCQLDRRSDEPGAKPSPLMGGVHREGDQFDQGGRVFIQTYTRDDLSVVVPNEPKVVEVGLNKGGGTRQRQTLSIKLIVQS
jgi:hypothetical protein